MEAQKSEKGFAIQKQAGIFFQALRWNFSAAAFLGSLGVWILLGSISVSAQSTNPDRPTPLTQGELRVSVPNNQTKYYYTFMLGEGELKLTADVTGTSGYIRFEIVNEDFKPIGNGSSGSWDSGYGGPTKRSVTRYNSIKRQKVFLILSTNSINGCSLILRMEGSFEPGQGTSVVTPGTTTTQPPVVVVAPPTTDSGNPKTITITLKNGQTVTGKYDSRGFLRNGLNNKLTINLQGKGIPEFDMNQVQSITIY